ECAVPVPSGTTCPYFIKKQETLDWLEEKLEEFEGEPVILFSHHPFVRDFTKAFSSSEIDKVKMIIGNENVLANFGGHIHGFDKFLGFKDVFLNANKDDYPVINITPVITTEALMVGSNEKEIKGIIRIVKINSSEKLEPEDYNNWETTEGERTEFVALNPQFDWYISKNTPEGEPLEYTFKAQYFTKREISSFEWDFGSWLGKNFGETVTILREKLEEAMDLGILEKVGLNKVKLPVKLTLTDQKTQQNEYLLRDEIINLGYGYSLLLPTTNQAISLKSREKLTVENREGVIVQIDEIQSEAKPVALIRVNFDQATQNIDLTDLVARSNSETRKSILYMPKWPNLIEKSKALFIPK
ncbi:hypothetical protein J7J39_02395, partial [bacterium]|nr:hypothetical protein [bacterium]